MLVRTDFTRERLDRLAAASGVVTLTDDELAASRSAVLGSRDPDGDLWVFAYGSLMWNPAIAFVEARTAALPGWERSFCIDLRGGRGSPTTPGLMCALVPSGSCHGVALRIAASDVEAETEVLWLREMAFGHYLASWLPLTIQGQVVDGLAFVADPARVVRLDLDEQARRIAAAEGAIGSNRDYLFRLAEALKAHRITDGYITALAARVRTVNHGSDRPLGKN
jgi:cation transport protein ChaC